MQFPWGVVSDLEKIQYIEDGSKGSSNKVVLGSLKNRLYRLFVRLTFEAYSVSSMVFSATVSSSESETFSSIGSSENIINTN